MKSGDGLRPVPHTVNESEVEQNVENILNIAHNSIGGSELESARKLRV